MKIVFLVFLVVFAIFAVVHWILTGSFCSSEPNAEEDQNKIVLAPCISGQSLIPTIHGKETRNETQQNGCNRLKD